MKTISTFAGIALLIQATSTAAPPIVGAWQFGDGVEDVSGVVVFLPNGIYFIAEDTVENTLEFDGMERGTYSWTETTGEFNATPILDTNGEIGLNDPLDQVLVNGDEMTITDSDEMETLTRVFSPTSRIVGAWQFGDGAEDESGVVVFLPNGIYFMAEDTLENTLEFDGMERGTYSWNETTGEFNATPILDTNGEIGLNDPPHLASIRGDEITFTSLDGIDTLERVFYTKGSIAISQSENQIAVHFTGILEESDTLNPWKAIPQQPDSPWSFPPAEPQKFFKARSK